MLFSVMVSKAEVASSNKTNGGSFNKHRAMAARCFSPPESLSPRSPTMVSQPNSSSLMKSSNCASFAACSSSSSVASRLPYRKLERIVSLNMQVACGTTPIACLNCFCEILRISIPLILTAPRLTS
mmetsp:Transcript_38183/g.92405  ORF Transcript_38183/g.92405 Transcript_38183/m.92405 type:complete len:126 (+) Transcript_38183:384-761(+)